MDRGTLQSDNISNYSGLLCKAANAGYSAIMILAGMHNNLRSQTQERIDTGLLGVRHGEKPVIRKRRQAGWVGLLKQTEFQNLPIIALTSSKAQGDFRKTVAEALGIPVLGGTPVVFVVKKNKSVLENLCQWLNDRTGDAAALIIDDKADNASINTGTVAEPGEDPLETDPTTINRLIRTLLLKFKKRAYVGYTATPFANIFIHSQAQHSAFGADLFPSAFILNLHTPSNHVAPAELFGLPEDRSVGQEEREGLPVVRTVDRDEAQGFMQFGHKKDYRPLGLPPSMKKAIRSFLLSCALRVCRGQESEHQSMLVHVTRFVDVQAQLRALVRAEVHALASTLKMEGSGNVALMKELKALWEKDYLPTATAVAAEWDDPLMTPVTWNCVRKRLAAVTSRIQVETMKGEAGDIRYYKEARNGCYIIAIGGDKLSRGLTLEGLTVSYFLRPSHMYDTLMQMGRWFGYRPEYDDLCRVWMPNEAKAWYTHIAESIDELRDELRRMEASNATPEEFGLKVRSHPDTLIVTARNKMGTSKKLVVSIGLGNSFVETAILKRDLNANRDAVVALAANLTALGKPPASAKNIAGGFLLQEVPAVPVLSFLSAFQNHPGSMLTDPLPVSQYIQDRLDGELSSWDILFPSVSKPDHQPLVDNSLGISITCQRRGPGKRSDQRTLYVTDNQRVASRGIEKTGLDDAQRLAAEQEYRKTAAYAEGSTNYPDRIYRATRTRPLLIVHLLSIGEKGSDLRNQSPEVAWSISFPETNKEAKRVEYVVNTTWMREHFREDLEEDEMGGDDES